MFNKVLRWTIVAVFFLIFIGSVVRSTGAGMGCPDWPRCFGSYIPPTSAENLPKDYVTFYTESRIRKNKKLEQLFVFFGLEDVLYNTKKGHTTYEHIEFDALKAWIEYINRLVGVIVGFLVLGVFLLSFNYIKNRTRYVVISTVSLVLLLIQAYLGSVVVSTNLLPGMISTHMLLAVLLQFLLMYMLFDLKKNTLISLKTNFPKWIMVVSFVVIILSFIQMFLGINVRESVDALHHAGISNDGIIDRVIASGNTFYIHRSFSIVLFSLNVWLIYLLSRYGVANSYSSYVLPLIILSMLTGVILGYFDLNSFAQPFHLLLATLLLGTQFLNFLCIKFVSK